VQGESSNRGRKLKKELKEIHPGTGQEGKRTRITKVAQRRPALHQEKEGKKLLTSEQGEKRGGSLHR